MEDKIEGSKLLEVFIEYGDLFGDHINEGEKQGLVEQNSDWRLWGCRITADGKLIGLGSRPLSGMPNPSYGWMALPGYEKLVKSILENTFWGKGIESSGR